MASPEQVEFIAAQCGNYRLAILLSAWSAVRLGELLALTRQDVTKRNEQYWVRISKQVQSRGEGLYATDQKSGAGCRPVQLREDLNNDVETHLRNVEKAKDSLLFPRTGGGWTHPNTLRNIFDRARDRWNKEHEDDTLDHFTLHALRHT
ncbi:site-specific integrase, partial [Mycobacterium tuberculosis]|nr:site-specific integrase [Mycobacterium tuberculosis]